MAGSKTRFGFSGNGEEPPDSGKSGAARTVIGHDIHLQKVPSGFARQSASPTPLSPTPMPRTPLPRAPILAPMPEQITESVAVRRPHRPQKSRLARFLGRWTTGGHFRSRSRMGDGTILDEDDESRGKPAGRAGGGPSREGLGTLRGFPDEDDLELPRDTTGRNVLLVLAIALLTFGVTFAIVKIRQRYAAPQPAPGAKMLEPRTEQTPSPQMPAPALPATPPPARPATPAPAEKPVLLGTPPAAATPAGPPRPRSQTARPVPAQAATAPLPSAAPSPSGRPHPRKRAQTETPAAELPEHLKGELLPLTP